MVDLIIILLAVGIVVYSIYRYVKRQKSGGGCEGCSGSCGSGDKCDTQKHPK